MKKLLFAFVLYAIGVAKIVDWILFWNSNKSLALNNRNLFLEKYYNRFPNFIQPIIASKYPLEEFIFLAIFIIAGIIFWRKKHLLFKIIAITAFLFAFWHLFSIL